MDYSAPTGSHWKLAPSGSPAEATTSAPTAATTPTPTAHQRRWPPLHRWLAGGGCHLSVCEEVLAPSSYGGEDKTIQEHGRHLHGVRRLVRPPGQRQSSAASGAGDTTDAVDLCTARPSPVQWTNSRASLGDRRQRWRRHQNHQSQRDGATARLASHPKELGARGMDPWLSPLTTFTRLVIILPPKCWRKKWEGASPPRTSCGGRRRWSPEG
jgi:hypothetical protein